MFPIPTWLWNHLLVASASVKVFISWSGDLSRQVADLVGEWIENVLQGVQKWISADDIEKGSQWFGEIGKQFDETSVGILCLTADNTDAPWIHFEAGALSKGLSKSRVIPLLVNLKPSDIHGPLSNFNATLPTRDEMLKLVNTINAQRGPAALAPDRVLKAFHQWWGDFEQRFDRLIKEYKPPARTHRRPLDEKVDEILAVVRSVQTTTQDFATNAMRTEQMALARMRRNSPTQEPPSYLSPVLFAALTAAERDAIRRDLARAFGPKGPQAPLHSDTEPDSTNTPEGDK